MTDMDNALGLVRIAARSAENALQIVKDRKDPMADTADLTDAVGALNSIAHSWACERDRWTEEGIGVTTSDEPW